MLKKLLCLLLVCAMLVPLSPIVTVTAEQETPSIEEILNNYHAQAFAAQAQGERGAATYSRRSRSQTLEEEAVGQLTAAGYDAFNVTTSNYTALEDELQTDFAEMGLDPEGSYIVVVSGEEDDTANSNGARVAPPSYEDYDGGGSGLPTFTYIYNGNVYLMRYVTVTAAENSNLGGSTPVNLLAEAGAANGAASLEYTMQVISYIPGISILSDIYSLFSGALPEIHEMSPTSLVYTAGTNWTITYVQVYNRNTEQWKLCSGVEYVTSTYSITYSFYNETTNQYDYEFTTGAFPNIYSPQYNNREYIKQIAAQAFENGNYPMDTIEDVDYIYNGKTVVTHHRWLEYLGYEPA